MYMQHSLDHGNDSICCPLKIQITPAILRKGGSTTCTLYMYMSMHGQIHTPVLSPHT